jgi:hypothetical protein
LEDNVRVLHSSYSALRRLRALAIGIMAGALLLSPAVRVPISQAAGTIEATQNISNTSDMSEAPQIALGGGRLGAVWGERNSDAVDWSTTTPTASWPGPGTKDVGGNMQYQWPDVVVDSAGTVHILYASGDTVYHRSDPTTGSLSAAHKVAGSSFPNPVRLAIAPNGTLWAVWRDTDGSGIFYRRSTDGGLNWTNGSDGGTVAKESGNMFSPDVAVGPDNVPHVVWYIRGSGSLKGEIRIADWNGSSFVKSSVTNDGGDGGCCYDADPSIAVGSGGTIHLAWRKQVGDNWAITYANHPAGGSWQSFTPVAVTSGDAKYGPSIGIDSNATAYVIFSSPTGGGRPRKVVLYSKAPGAAWDGPLTLGSGPWDSRTGIVGGNGVAYSVHQHEVGSDDGEIIYNRIQFGAPAPVAPAVGATPVLDSGLPTTRNSVVAVGFTNVSGSPDSVRYHWDSAPTDSDSWVTFANPLLNVPGPSGVTADACQTHTLYTQVRKGTTLGGVEQDSETFDVGVQAAVDILNPHLTGLPTFFGKALHDVYVPNGGSSVSNGDPNYTREGSFYLGIRGSADCSGLKTYTVTGSSINQTITNNSYTGTPALPQGSSPGKRDIKVDVNDALGNTQAYTKTLFYDPANTDTTGTLTDTKGLPVLADGGTVTANSTNSIIRSFSFKDISVTDNLYGQQDGLPKLADGKQFWGVWMANTTSSTATADDPSLNWYPVEVPTPDSEFSVTWDLFAGLNYTSDLLNKPGDYYVFVRFLDGAGNPSTNFIKTKVTLTAGYSIPTRRLPVLTR